VRARRDPAWVADGYVSERWLPISPFSGKIDAFVWAVPSETFSGPLLEQVAQQALAEAKATASKVPPPTIIEMPAAIAAAKNETLPKSPGPAAEPRASRRKAVGPVVAEPPLPDDPGPDPEAETLVERPRFKLFQW
jgi:HemY protein